MNKQVKLYIIDTVCNYAFFVPLVSATIWIGSRSLEAVIAYAIGAIPISLFSGRLFGVFLSFVRRLAD